MSSRKRASPWREERARLTSCVRRVADAMKYGVTLVESDEGWAVWCDSLPGCCSQGATKRRPW